MISYKTARKFIDSTCKFGSKPGLIRIQQLLTLMGNPEAELKIIHVAGTNGKGSTTSYISNILISQGYKTGKYISPFVDEFLERIQINGKKISQREFCLSVENVKVATSKMLDLGFEHPTEFEIITAVAFDFYKRANADFVVLEVGLGGRFDATNAIEKSLLSVITPISFDHTEYLGDTIKKIAFEKAGIIKQNTPVCLAASQKEDALEVIKKEAETKGCKLIIPDEKALKVDYCNIEGSAFLYKGEKFTISMLGRHQIQNAMTAIETANTLNELGHKISLQSIKKGLKATTFNGRLEIIGKSPYIIADGAHNEDGVKVLKNAIKELFGGKKIIAVMGILKDKNYSYCIGEIAGLSKTFIATAVPNPRTLDENITYNEAKKHCGEVYCKKNIADAVELAINLAKKDDAIFICGSLYLIGDAKKSLKST